MFFLTTRSGSARPWYSRSEFYTSASHGLSTHVVDDRPKAHGEISKGNDNVTPDHWILARFQDLEQQLEVGLAELSADTHKLGQGQRSCLSKCRRLCVSAQVQVGIDPLGIALDWRRCAQSSGRTLPADFARHTAIPFHGSS